MRTRAAISLRDVTKQFPGADAPAVTSLTLDVAEGEILALVGPSGCGKTTILRMINRLIEPTSGTIEVLGFDQDSIAGHLLRRRIGYVIQQIGLFPHQTVRRNIGAVPALLGWAPDRIEERCEELAELVGLDRDLLDRYPSSLSGGQQQRVGVARALAADPPILLMDEPYSAVDPIVRQRLQDDLLVLQRRLHKTIVIVTHDIDEAIKLADTVVIIGHGGIIAQAGPPLALLHHPVSEFVEAFLGRERGLRQLALRQVREITCSTGPAVSPSASITEALECALAHRSDWVAVIDSTRLLGRLRVAAMTAVMATSETEPLTVADALNTGVHLEEFADVVTPTTSLREALDVVVTSPVHTAVVIEDGCYLGMLTSSDIANGIGP